MFLTLCAECCGVDDGAGVVLALHHQSVGGFQLAELLQGSRLFAVDHLLAVGHDRLLAEEVVAAPVAADGHDDQVGLVLLKHSQPLLPPLHLVDVRNLQLVKYGAHNLHVEACRLAVVGTIFKGCEGPVAGYHERMFAGVALMQVSNGRGRRGFGSPGQQAAGQQPG